MKFIKENSYDILKLYINQLGITIFSLVLYFAVSSIEDIGTHSIVKTAVSVFSTLFYFALVYTATWDIGAKDKIRVDGGRMNRQIYKGVLMGLLANALNLLLLLLGFISLPFSDIGFFANMLAVTTTIFRFTTAMYIGIVQAVFGNMDILFQLLGGIILSSLAIFVTHIGYYLGMHEKKIFSSKHSGKTNK